ncbi:Alpha/Beta hydrolase protein [Lasiosphaeria hispida]|uniref:Alpha/Beta hydrolase protein n=1 Tax=Lasiosphaeria hispida TaxID=260671 RepID=A0AAJ0MGV7_9PEZI|nr:Alpha/Beta hydrolase protein [Lasiosphaeria hispida]
MIDLAKMSSQTQLIELHPDVKINAIISNGPTTPSTSALTLPTIIFLHFWGGSSLTWSLVNPLTSASYPTVALDFRGWGDSTGPDAKDAYSISLLADDVEATIAALKIRSAVLVGLSMGAKVAQLIAARGKAPLRGLVLVSPAPVIPLILPEDMREQQLHAYDNEDSARFVATNVLTASYRERDLPEFVVEDMLRGNRWARQAWPAYGIGEDVSEGVGGISVPVLVIAAEKDVVEPVERVQTEVCARIQGSKLVVLSGSGHLSPLDKPEDIAECLLRFLGEFCSHGVNDSSELSIRW